MGPKLRFVILNLMCYICRCMEEHVIIILMRKGAIGYYHVQFYMVYIQHFTKCII